MNLLQRLQSEFGDAVETWAATSDDAVDEVAPRAVAAPRDEDAAQVLMGWCGREKVVLIPRGGGSAMGFGAKPEGCNLIVSTQYLNRVLDHDEGNATVSAQAGISLSELDQVVGRRGQFVPLDGARDGSRSTLGGAIATNRTGSSKLKYGAPRDLIVGLHAALSDGRLVKAGSKVVKNVSGYDLNKIFIGSHGSLGLITEVTLRLRPNDVASRVWRSTPASWEEAAQTAQQIVNGPFEPTSLQLKSAAGSFRLTAQFDGGEAAVQAQLDRLPPTIDSISNSPKVDAGVLQLCAVLPMQSAFDWARRAQESGSPKVLWECGLGTVRVVYSELPDNVSEIVQALRATANAVGGAMIVEQAPAAMKTSEFVWGETPQSWKLMQQLKHKYDPARVCAPGRFVGGL